MREVRRGDGVFRFEWPFDGVEAKNVQILCLNDNIQAQRSV